MRRAVGVAGATLAAVALSGGAPWSALTATAAPEAGSGKLTVTSTNISPGGKIADGQVFNGFGCKGGNLSPELSWSGGPAGTKSFAILMHDPDAPTGSGWWHWVVYNIPANVSSIPAGAGDPKKSLLPSGAVQGRTDYGEPGYGGPCPPPGRPHRYFIRVYALKVEKLEVPADATAAFVGFSVRMHALATGELMGTYGR